MGKKERKKKWKTGEREEMLYISREANGCRRG
jgi:hypothetical protein